ncbi:MAG: FtsH protease activity modulator HflK, partial [Moraxellaceae bacterium]
YGTQTAGLHWAPPLIDRVQKVDIQNTRRSSLNATMITEDANIVDIALDVQYRVSDAKKYLMHVSDPEASLLHASESALRHVVGSSKMVVILNEGRATIARDMQPRLQRYLDSYQTGLTVVAVSVLEALPPKDVKAAFDDVIRAKEDMERLRNQAETYANGIIPEARGQAARLLAEAEGYKQEVVDRATGDAARFDQLINEYRKAPGVTRTRLYQETMEAVLGKTTKIVVEGGNNQMLYLPLDKLVPPPGALPQPPAALPSQDTPPPSSGRSSSRLQESRS